MGGIDLERSFGDPAILSFHLGSLPVLAANLPARRYLPALLPIHNLGVSLSYFKRWQPALDTVIVLVPEQDVNEQGVLGNEVVKRCYGWMNEWMNGCEDFSRHCTLRKIISRIAYPAQRTPVWFFHVINSPALIRFNNWYVAGNRGYQQEAE